MPVSAWEFNPVALYFNHIALVQFKNLETCSRGFQPGFHFITGPNGSGKTNFLDALYYLCMTRSFLKASDRLLLRHGADFFRLEAGVADQNKSHELVIKCKPPGLKELSWDGKRSDRISEHLGRIPVVVIAPDEVFTLIREQEERRKFLNQTLVQIDPEYVDQLMAYNRLLKQRNAALKQMKTGGRIDHALLDALESPMVRHAAYIAWKRKQLVERLDPLIKTYVGKISKDQQSAEMVYHTDVAEDFDQILKSNRERDYFAQRTGFGVHRDQVSCKMGDHQLADVGSQGQLKSFVVAMKLAQYHYLKKENKTSPVVLLDDIFAKLDAQRVVRLLDVLAEEAIEQCFITDTHEDRAKALMGALSNSAYLYRINQGCIE
ncbi:MAG TPA: DNA replication and repair protein RecF [Saprospiraceae bacterium]|nr:DNA replication and repair protein RecF [Saprospiraceae bacterium]